MVATILTCIGRWLFYLDLYFFHLHYMISTTKSWLFMLHSCMLSGVWCLEAWWWSALGGVNDMTAATFKYLEAMDIYMNKSWFNPTNCFTLSLSYSSRIYILLRRWIGWLVQWCVSLHILGYSIETLSARNSPLWLASCLWTSVGFSISKIWNFRGIYHIKLKSLVQILGFTFWLVVSTHILVFFL